MSNLLVLAGVILGAFAFLGLALSISLLIKGRPVSHCGGASREFGSDCPVCGSSTGCAKPEGGAPTAGPEA